MLEMHASMPQHIKDASLNPSAPPPMAIPALADLQMPPEVEKELDEKLADL